MLVLVDFQGQLEDELNVKAGDIIVNVKKTVEEGWLCGEINGKRGFIPLQYVKEIPSVFLNDTSQRFPRSIRKNNAVIQKKQQRWCKANYSYNPSKQDELELSAGEIFEVLEEIEDGWWLGKKGALVGAFPSNFVQEITEPPQDKVPKPKKNNKQRPKMLDVNFSSNDAEKTTQDDNPRVKNHNKDNSSPPPTVKEFCKIMFDYIPSMKDELAVKKGDVVLILSKETEDEGWWRGELNGETGLFPDNFAILLPPKSHIKTNKLPTRTPTVKGPVLLSVVKTDLSVMDKKIPEVNRPESPASKGQKEPRETKTDPAPKVIHHPAKKSAPPPPIAAKSKPIAIPANKPSTEPPIKSVENVKEKFKEPRSSSFDGLKLASTKLSHPTVDRPKIQGKRLPKTKTTEPENAENLPEPVFKKEEEAANSHRKTPLPAEASPKSSTTSMQELHPNTKTSTPPPSATQMPKQSSEPAAAEKVEELMMEIKSLQLMMEIINNKHMKDMADIRGEIDEERAKRTALQIAKYPVLLIGQIHMGHERPWTGDRCINTDMFAQMHPTSFCRWLRQI
ncbi:SH3 domain-containing protein 21 isoform X2 [Ascaphus truei]